MRISSTSLVIQLVVQLDVRSTSLPITYLDAPKAKISVFSRSYNTKLMFSILTSWYSKDVNKNPI